MTSQAWTQAHFSSDRLPTSGELLKETKILFNHQGSDAELVRQIAIAVRAISTLNPKP